MTDSMRVERDVVYGVAGRELLCDVYHPAEANGGAIIFLHGGGWRVGDRSTMKDAATRLAGRGYLTVAPEYRLVGEALWPAQLQDVKAAIRWLRANADRLGVQPDMIALCGFSAGAHLALMAGGTPDDPTLRDGAADAGVSDRVNALIAFFPPARLEAGQARTLGIDPTNAASVSPIERVSSAFPPVLLLHGTGDTTLPHSQSTQMFDALAAAGVAVDLRLYAGLPHEFVRLPGVLDACAADIDLFLHRHLLDRQRFDAELTQLRQWWAERAQATRPAGAH